MENPIEIFHCLHENWNEANIEHLWKSHPIIIVRSSQTLHYGLHNLKRDGDPYFQSWTDFSPLTAIHMNFCLLLLVSEVIFLLTMSFWLFLLLWCGSWNCPREQIFVPMFLKALTETKRIWRFFCCCCSSYGRPLNILKWNSVFRIKLTNCGSGPCFCSSPPKQKWFCCIHDLVILSWLFDAKIFLFLFCFGRWRQLRSQATTEISGRLFPAFRWSLFKRRKINIHSGNLSSFLQRAQMWLEVIWRRSLHAHLLSQQMLLQSYRVVNQQNVLLFPDFPFLM